MRRLAAPFLARAVLQLRVAGLVLLLALQLSGCIIADGVLEPDGTGKLTLTYAAAQGTDEAMEREKLKVPGITIESFSMAPDRKVTAVLRVTDLAALGKMALLKGTTVTTGTDGDAKTLTVAALTKALPRKPAESVPGPSIRLTLPGSVIDATESGVVDGSTVKWSFPLRTWLERPEWKLTARYRPAQPGAPAAPKPD